MLTKAQLERLEEHISKGFEVWCKDREIRNTFVLARFDRGVALLCRVTGFYVGRIWFDEVLNDSTYDTGIWCCDHFTMSNETRMIANNYNIRHTVDILMEGVRKWLHTDAANAVALTKWPQSQT